MTREDLHEMYRRWRAGHPIQQMARAIQGDRKTIRHYLNKFQQAGLSQAGPEVDKQALEELFDTILPATERVQPARQELSCYEQLIREWIQDEREPVKPKSAYQILRSTYHIRASYESFKLFVRQKGLNAKSKKQVLRIELPPGQEQQIDYGRVGWLEDPRGGQNRVVWAFCTVLSCSRLPFIQYVYTQRQVAFADSLIDALEFYQGTTEFISIDNLKSGVTKPDLWDPVLNKTLAEVADYYGLFINPCRVGKSTDKGKVERLIGYLSGNFLPSVSGEDLGLEELNEHVLAWLADIGEQQLRDFSETREERFTHEREHLSALPLHPLDCWESSEVHVSRESLFAYEGARYSVPAELIGETLRLKRDPLSRTVELFHERHQVRRFTLLPPGERGPLWDPADRLSVQRRWEREQKRRLTAGQPRTPQRPADPEVDIRSPSLYERLLEEAAS
jgi:transposase